MNFYRKLSKMLKAVIGKFVLSISSKTKKKCANWMNTTIEPLIISIGAESDTKSESSDTDTELALQ